MCVYIQIYMYFNHLPIISNLFIKKSDDQTHKYIKNKHLITIISYAHTHLFLT